MSYINKILIDTTYLLPIFGIEVESFDEQDILKLKMLYEKGKIEFYCLDVIWTELIAKVAKEMIKHHMINETLIDEAVKSILKSGVFKWISPNAEAIKLAFKLRILGHKDMIDNLLYSTAKVKGFIFMSMDESFRNFLRKNNMDVSIIMNHKEIIRSLE